MGRWGLAVVVAFTGACTSFVGIEATSESEGSSGGPIEMGPSTGDPVGTTSGSVDPDLEGSTSDTSWTSTSTSSGAPDEESSSSSSTGDTGEPEPVAPGCANGLQDVNETDVDCGGACSPCDAGATCVWYLDCASASCVGGFCSASDLVVWLDADHEETVHQAETCDLPAEWDGDAVQCWQNLGLAGDALVVQDGDDVLGTPDGVIVDGAYLLIDSPFDDAPLGDVWMVLASEVRSDTNSFDLNLAHPDQTAGGRYSAHLPWAGNQRMFWDPDIGNRISSAPNLVAVGQTHLFGLLNSQTLALRAIQLNGATVASAEDGTPQETADFSIGRGADLAIRELRVYSPAPPGAERQQIEGELACKWGIRDQLPMTHPFFHEDGESVDGCEMITP